METGDGLLLALSTAPTGRAEEYNQWYDEEHAPARLRVPGIRTARRYRDVDDPSRYLAYYDLDSPTVLDRPEYLALTPGISDRDRRLLAEVTPDRRVYAALATPEVSRASDHDVCGDVLLAVWWTPQPGTEDDFNAWYTDEHIPLLMKVPGWLRARRYRLLHGDGPRYLALHDLASEQALREPAHDAAGRTPWRRRVVEHRREYERRVFRLWRRFDEHVDRDREEPRG